VFMRISQRIIWKGFLTPWYFHGKWHSMVNIPSIANGLNLPWIIERVTSYSANEFEKSSTLRPQHRKS